MKQRQKWPWIVGGLLVILIAAGVVLAPRLLAEQAAGEPATGEVVEVVRGDLAASASASGRVETARTANLALAQTGRVEAVMVEVGDAVDEGQVLVLLDKNSLERAVVRAEQSLAIQQATLEQLEEGAAAAQVAATQAALESAQAELDDLLAGPAEEQVAAAEANLRAAQANVAAASRRLGETRTAGADEASILQAEANLEDAQQAEQAAEEAYTRTLECDWEAGEAVNCRPRDEDWTEQARLNLVAARERLAAAQADLERLQGGADANTVSVSQASVAQVAAQRDAAQANLDLLLAGPTAAQIAAAEASVAEARASLARLQAGPSAADRALAKAGVEQARIGLQQARNELENATLRAPFAGVVTAVHVSEGETASGVAVTLVDTGNLQVRLDVDEVDLGPLEPGQPAEIVLEAWPDTTLEGQILSISPAANNLQLNNAIATYEVRLGLPETELPLRVGMTANASLETARRDDVLLVPNRAITADRDSGQFFVRLVETGPDGQETSRRVPVVIGLRDARYTEIREGLSSGDRIQIGNVDAPIGDIFTGERREAEDEE